jgi:DNA-binding transcriptional LysR family regulator
MLAAMATPLLDTEDARCFVAVADALSISRAAIALGTSQSNVSARLARLEARAGTPLVRRHSRGVSLTGAGEALLPNSRELLQLAQRAMASVQAGVTALPELRIGAFHTATASLVPRLLSGFIRKNRGVRLTVRAGTTEEVRALLADDRVDCAFLAGAAVDAGMTLQARFSEELGWVAKAGTVRPGGRPLLQVLAELPIYSVRRGALYEASVRQLFQDAGFTPAMPLFQEAGSTEILREMLALGGCFTLAGRSVFANEIRAGVLAFHPVAAQTPRLQTALVCKRGKAQQEVPAAFVRYAKAAAAA